MLLGNINQSLRFWNEACLIIVKGGKIHRREIYNNFTKQHWSEDLYSKEVKLFHITVFYIISLHT